MKTTIFKPIICIFILSILMSLFSGCIKTKDVIDPESLEKWEIFNKSSGLANNFVWCINEDNQGNIWVGTNGGGLSKYNGEFWTTYNLANFQIINDTVTSIVQDKSGAFWIGTYAGLSYYEANEWYYFSDFDGIQISSLCVTSGGDVLIGTNGWGYFYWDTDHFVQEFDSECGMCNYINTIYMDNSGNIWMGTYGGLKKYNQSNYSSYDLYTTDNFLITDDIYAIKEDSWGNLWIGGFGGEKVVKYSNGKFMEVSLYNDMPTYILSIEEDKYGSIWFGGIDIGAVEFDGTIMKSYFQTDGLPDNTIVDILSDKNGDLWFATTDNGVGRYRSYLNK